MSRRSYWTLDDMQMYNAYNLFRFIGRWIWLPNPLLSSKCIQLLDPLLALPCSMEQLFSSSFLSRDSGLIVSSLCLGLRNPGFESCLHQFCFHVNLFDGNTFTFMLRANVIITNMKKYIVDM